MAEVCELYADWPRASISTLERLRKRRDWDAKRAEFWSKVNDEVTKFVGEGTAERESKMLRAVQSTGTVLSGLGGLVSLELVRLRPQIEARAISSIQAALLLRTLSTAARSIANGHVSLIAAERTLMDSGDAALKELYREFDSAWQVFTEQRDAVVAQRQLDNAPDVTPALPDEPHANGDALRDDPANDS